MGTRYCRRNGIQPAEIAAVYTRQGVHNAGAGAGAGAGVAPDRADIHSVIITHHFLGRTHSCLFLFANFNSSNVICFRFVVNKFLYIFSKHLFASLYWGRVALDYPLIYRYRQFVINLFGILDPR